MREQFGNIVSLIRQSQERAIRAVNTELINLYWLVGEYISRQVAACEWGEKTVDKLAKYIAKQHSDIKGFNRRSLYRMKQFYELYKNSSIVSPLVTQIQTTDNQNDIIASTLSTQFNLFDIHRCCISMISIPIPNN